jgi:hypothetical protein
MDALPTVINTLVVAVATTVLWFITRAQTSALERRMDRHEDRTEARFDRLETKLEGRIESVESKLEAKIDAVRADITQLAFRLGERPHPQTG